MGNDDNFICIQDKSHWLFITLIIFIVVENQYHLHFQENNF